MQQRSKACERARVSTRTRVRTACMRACIHREGCGISLASIYFLIAAKLSWPSWQVPSLFLPRETAKGKQGTRPGQRGRGRRKGWERPYITAHEKRPSAGRLISEALPPAPFKASANPRPEHESRHSAASPTLHPFSPPCPLQTYGHGARR